jgi:hypothetical protein
METICKNCGHKIKGTTVFCPSCRQKLSGSTYKESIVGYLFIIFIFLVIIATAVFIILSLNSKDVLSSYGFDISFFGSNKFIDDFETLDNRNWEIWRKDKGVLITTQSDELVLKNGAIGLKDINGPEFLLECNMKVYEATSDYSWAGISFGTTKNGRYLVQFLPIKDKILLHRVPGEIIEQTSINIPEEKWILIAIRTKDDTTAVFMNKKQILQVSKLHLTSGFIGLEAAYTTALFDNFSIEDLNQD